MSRTATSVARADASAADASPEPEEAIQKPPKASHHDTPDGPKQRNPIEELFRKNRREDRLGLGSAGYEELLAKIRGEKKDDESIGSGLLGEQSADTSLGEKDMRKLTRDLPDEFGDEQLIRDLAGEEVEEITWKGFWDDQSILSKSHQAIRSDTPELGLHGVKGRLLQLSINQNGKLGVVVRC